MEHGLQHLQHKIMKTTTKLIKWWKLKTPLFARILQSISVAVAAIPLYYSSLPERFQLTIPDNVILYISLVGLIATFLLNFLHVKEK